MTVRKQTKPTDQLVVASWMLVAASAVIFAFAWWYWMVNVAHSPHRLLWTAFDQALSTQGVTTYVSNEVGGQTFRQDTSVRTGVDLQSRSIVKVQADAGSIVESETLGTRSASYIRYRQLAGPSGDLNPDVKDRWARIEEENAAADQLLTDGLSSTIVMVGNLPRDKRTSLISKLRDTQAIRLTRIVSEGAVVDGRKVDVFGIEIDPVLYFDAMKAYFAALGLNAASEAIDIRQAGTELITAEVAIHAPSGQFVKLGIPTIDATNAVHYVNWGASLRFEVPEQQLSYGDLQSKLIRQKEAQ